MGEADPLLSVSTRVGSKPPLPNVASADAC